MSNEHATQIAISHATYKKAMGLLRLNSVSTGHNILRQATTIEKAQAYVSSIIKTAVRRYRSLLGFCPACNSSAPECDTCEECNKTSARY